MSKYSINAQDANVTHARKGMRARANFSQAFNGKFIM